MDLIQVKPKRCYGSPWSRCRTPKLLAAHGKSIKSNKTILSPRSRLFEAAICNPCSICVRKPWCDHNPTLQHQLYCWGRWIRVAQTLEKLVHLRISKAGMPKPWQSHWSHWPATETIYFCLRARLGKWVCRKMNLSSQQNCSTCVDCRACNLLSHWVKTVFWCRSYFIISGQIAQPAICDPVLAFTT